jgi:hypothetical protein
VPSKKGGLDAKPTRQDRMSFLPEGFGTTKAVVDLLSSWSDNFHVTDSPALLTLDHPMGAMTT